MNKASKRRDCNGDASHGGPVDVGGRGTGFRRLQHAHGEADRIAGHVSEADEGDAEEAGEVEDRVLLVARLSEHVL